MLHFMARSNARPLVFIALLWAASHSAGALDLYVAPEGNDAWLGTSRVPTNEGTDGPLASLRGARDALRRLHRTQAINENITVHVADGRYELGETLVFKAEDGGTESQIVSYQAEAGAHPVFSGGRRITGFKPGPEGIYVAEIPAVAAGAWYFEQLFVDGQRATRARTPNQGSYHLIAGVTGADPRSATKEADRRAFIARPEDLASLPLEKTSAPGQIEVIVYHAWETSRHRLQSADLASGRVDLQTAANWPFLYWGKERYYFENFREALDSEGEWYLDARQGLLFYKPLAGQNMSTAEVIAPVLERLVAVRGSALDNQLVRNLHFKGLQFSHSQSLLPASGYADAQAAISTGAAIEADGARNLRFEDCGVAHTGSYAIWLRKDVTDSAVSACSLQDLGAGGIRVGEHYFPDPKYISKNNSIYNNSITQGGLRYPSGVGVWIGHSADNRVAHNSISDLRFTAISVGWTWGYGASVAYRNLIEFNRISNIGQGELSDLGGIYLLGPSEGTIVRNNVIHNIETFTYGAWGLYADEGTSGATFEKNIVTNAATGGFVIHYGSKNIVRNNLFSDSHTGQLYRVKNDGKMAATIVNNIITWSQGPLLTGQWSDDNFKLNNNIYCFTGIGSPPIMAAASHTLQVRGQDFHMPLADQGISIKKDMIFIRKNSRAAKLGFRSFNLATAGVIKN